MYRERTRPRKLHAGRTRHANYRPRGLPALGIRLEVVVSRIGRGRWWWRRRSRRTSGNREATRFQEASRPALQEQLAVGVRVVLIRALTARARTEQQTKDAA